MSIGIIFGSAFVGSYLGAATSTKVVTVKEVCEETDAFNFNVSPLTTNALKMWNYANPKETEQTIGGCKIQRLNADSWNINFKGCE